MKNLSPEVAFEILTGVRSHVRDEARRQYLRSSSVEELIDWINEATLAAALRHPKGATVLPANVLGIVNEVRLAQGLDPLGPESVLT